MLHCWHSLADSIQIKYVSLSSEISLKIAARADICSLRVAILFFYNCALGTKGLRVRERSRALLELTRAVESAQLNSPQEISMSPTICFHHTISNNPLCQSSKPKTGLLGQRMLWPSRSIWRWWQYSYMIYMMLTQSTNFICYTGAHVIHSEKWLGDLKQGQSHGV